MSKIPSKYKDPVDNILLSLTADNYLDHLYELGVTPNMITTLSNILRLVSVYFLFNGKKGAFFIFFFLGYYFDVLDGYFARRYKLFSEFGDFYDHFSDAIFGFVLVYYLFKWSSLSKTKYYWPVLIFYILTEILMFTNIGCVQKMSGSQTAESQDMYKMMCIDPSWIQWTRYFGSGPSIIKTGILASIF